jgi:hypothetical protein
MSCLLLFLLTSSIGPFVIREWPMLYVVFLSNSKLSVMLTVANIMVRSSLLILQCS